MYFVLSLVENYAKKNRNCFPIAVLLTIYIMLDHVSGLFRP